MSFHRRICASKNPAKGKTPGQFIISKKVDLNKREMSRLNFKNTMSWVHTVNANGSIFEFFKNIDLKKTLNKKEAVKK